MFTKKEKHQNNSELDKYIKSHLPAEYLLGKDNFENEAALLHDLELYFTKDQAQSITPEFKERLAVNYRSVKKLLTDIEPQYIETAIDELWEGLQEETIYGKYNKNGIISF